MNEKDMLMSFLREYLDGLDKVSEYEAVQVGVEMLVKNHVFRDYEEMSFLLSIECRIKISSERLRQMSGGRVMFLHPAIPA